ncbi:MAG: hypothetical protein K6G10_06760 [Butyrivibrio sp.]|nr:hypothetical protein [Butyrivibrio sp.]
MNEIKELLDEYTSITGRPIATLSVEEYLSFKKFLSKGNTVQKTITSDADKKITVQGASSQKQDIESEIKETKTAQVQPIRTSKPAKEHAAKPQNKQTDILSLLKSVPG